MAVERNSVSASASALADTRKRATASRVADDVLLDAARQCVLAVGIRRTTLAEIARTAQVSRMTLYRRFPDVRSVLAALMTREFGALLQRARLPSAHAPTARERLVASAEAAVRELAVDPLMRTVLTVDAELILPYIVRRLGATQRFAESVIAELVAAGHQDGSIRAGDSAAQTRSILLVVQSFIFSRIPAIADVPEEGLLTELRHFLETGLAARERKSAGVGP